MPNDQSISRPYPRILLWRLLEPTLFLEPLDTLDFLRLHSLFLLLPAYPSRTSSANPSQPRQTSLPSGLFDWSIGASDTWKVKVLGEEVMCLGLTKVTCSTGVVNLLEEVHLEAGIIWDVDEIVIVDQVVVEAEQFKAF